MWDDPAAGARLGVMSYHRSVFISATTKGFGEEPSNWRRWIKDILIKQEIDPVEQSVLRPEEEVIKPQIEQKICRVDGVICLIGPYFGARVGRPSEDGKSVASYTQYEWIETRRHRKKALVYLVEDEFFAEGIASEVTEKDLWSVQFRSWQEAFRDLVRQSRGEHQQLRVKTPVELALALVQCNIDIGHAMDSFREWPLNA
jgi:hypothetical protein